MTKPYEFAPGGLPERLQAYFRAHPGAELTQAQIGQMFHTSPGNVSLAVTKLSEMGELEQVRVVRTYREPAFIDQPEPRRAK